LLLIVAFKLVYFVKNLRQVNYLIDYERCCTVMLCQSFIASCEAKF